MPLNTCVARPARGIELEHYGVPFSRTDAGKIYQRPFGGMTTHYGDGTAHRTCAAADRTGHAILHSLYQQSLKHQAEFYIEYFTDLIMDDDGTCRGVLAWNLKTEPFTVWGSRSSRDRWLRSSLLPHLRAHLHRRRRWHGAPCWSP